MTNATDMDTSAVNEEDLDIDALNDSQLYEKLRENNIVAGPIVDSTREIYKKKLKKVLYGEDEESIASGGESELVNDGEDDEKFVAGEEEMDEKGDAAVPTEDEEEVVDGADESLYKSKSDADDDQPSGVSRPVDNSGLRKRASSAPRTDVESTKATEKRATEEKPTIPILTVVFFIVMVVLLLLAVGIFYSIDSEEANVPDAVDFMQEEIQAAANEATKGKDDLVDREEVFTF